MGKLPSGLANRLEGLSLAPQAAQEHRVPQQQGRLASWFVEQLHGEQSRFVRLSEGEEAGLDRALATALAGVRAPCNRVAMREGAISGIAGGQLYAAFRRELGGVNVSGLACVPLDGGVARRLPPELGGDVRVSAARLLASSGRSSSSRLPLAGASLGRVKAAVEELIDAAAPAVFKIGITCTPFMRFRSYAREGYAQMHLLYASEEPGAVQMLEAALIDNFQQRVGCRNVARGGEGPVGRAPYFAYLVLAPCGDGIGILRKRMRVERCAPVRLERIEGGDLFNG